MAKRKISPPIKTADAKLVSWEHVIAKSAFPLKKSSRAGVVIDRQGTPKFFIFNTSALLDVLSEIDERLVDHLSSAQYYSKATNPAGWLIDEIEKKLPLHPEFILSLRDAIDEAKKKGWVPFEKIQQELRAS